MVAHWSDDEIWHLNRGGHDPHKVYAAYHAAVERTAAADRDPRQDHQGLRHGRGGRSAEHHPPAEKDGRQTLISTSAIVSACRSDEDIAEKLPFYEPDPAQPEMQYMKSRRAGARRLSAAAPTPVDESLQVPELRVRDACSNRAKAARSRRPWPSCACSNTLLKDKSLGAHIVPIVADEARTFGMEGMFRQLGIWLRSGQLYDPVDADQLMFYKESKTGQILQEGITEAGRDVVLDCRATVLQHAWRADDSVLHLLLDVRLPACRRPRLGSPATACAWLPARRHRRPHDAERRRPAARGRSFACCRRR
jgi:pyruvate dehydrogenase E1 component